MSQQQDFWYYVDVNPEPWAMGQLGVGRRAGAVYPYVGPNGALVAFKEAVREALEGEPRPPAGEYTLKFFFFRKLETYQGEKKKVTKHQVDATNMQKAAEDALQGVLFANDRDVRSVSSTIVEQSTETTGGFALRIRMWDHFNPDFLPQFMWDRRDKATEETVQMSIDDYDSAPEDVF